jgi:Flp pilus assembly protein TadG
MRPPLIQRPQRNARHRTRERGVTIAIVAVSLVAIIAMAALSIDIGTLYEAKAEAQRAADAAALAAARTISMQGLTGDPANASGSWQQICGGAGSPANVAATTVAQQNLVAGVPPPPPTVTYSAPGAGTNTDCSKLGPVFGVNPQVTVLVQQSNLPIFFARVFSLLSSNYSNTRVSATATAEVFNPSNPATYGGSLVPVQPRCVKPLMVPNYDPSGNTCTGSPASPCLPFVNTATSALGNPGISLASGGSGGVIGERLWLLADCQPTGSNPCTFPAATPQPQANYTSAQGAAWAPPNLEYVPGQASFQSIAIPSDGSAACSAVSGNYAQAIAGCDQSTQYQCGVQIANTVDLSENPVTTDTTSGVECLIRQTSPYTSGSSPTGQDTLAPFSLPPTYPFQIQAGSGNPLIHASPNAVPGNGLITGSNNIVSLPIYDSPPGANTINPTGTTNVTIVGFLQAFINVVDANGNMYVTVLNVSGCGNAVPVGTQALYGTSPVPVRLITPP